MTLVGSALVLTVAGLLGAPPAVAATGPITAYLSPTTLQAIRERTHWNSAALAPMDPVTLGLCSQLDLDLEVNRAAKDRPAQANDQGATLVPAEITTAPRAPVTQQDVFGSTPAPQREQEEDIDLASVFGGKLKGLKTED